MERDACRLVARSQHGGDCLRITSSGAYGTLLRRDDERNLYEIPITFAVAPVSKTYAPGGTSAPANAIAVLRLAVHVAQEHPMLDIVMLALGLGFFVAGIGYAYACERL